MSGRKIAICEADWHRVFDLRCACKRGEAIREVDQALLVAAWKADPERYRAMNAEVFNATVPAGSSARAKG